ncbi:HDOD domain-containing protein [Magnetovirga frankeli]|uniref:HDOD domain-containing protein n=1 Tax=Magnetovirga frankeli TaxID=947516 RepID=UPI001293FCFF|nr:HDOD domain-containing protein [gamma proteobacterium SS-5]
MTENDDKKGDALQQQRFQMLKDIAGELSGDINFPTNFNLIIQLRETLNDPDWDLNDVVKLLSVEPLISSRLVGLANSAAYKRGKAEIGDLATAVKKLGINLVRTTAFGIATKQFLNARSMSVFSDISQWYWDHSLRTASAASVVNRHHGRFPPDMALLAGLIHDIGAFYLLYRASKYDELCKRPETVKYLIAQWHESMGHALLNALGLPEQLTEAIKEHDCPRAVAPVQLKTMADLVYVANILAGVEEEWRYIDGIDVVPSPDMLDEKFSSLGEEIEQQYLELRAAFA